MSLVRIKNNTLEIGPRISVGWILFGVIHLFLVSFCLFRFSTLKYIKPIPVYIVLVFIFVFVVMFATSIHSLLTNIFQKVKLEIAGDILKINTTLSLKRRMAVNLSEITSINTEIQTGLLDILSRKNGKFRVLVVAKGTSFLVSYDLGKSDADEVTAFIRNKV